MDRALAEGLLKRAPAVHVATTTPDGAPLLLTVHAVVVPGAISFHSEETEIIGREAIVSAEEIVASISGYLLFRSVQVRGRIERADDARDKGTALRVPLERREAKANLAQDRTPEERVRLMEQLWARGQRGDLEAIELVRAANPGTPLPAFLRGPAGTTLAVSLTEEDATAAAVLLDGAYWNDGMSAEGIALAHLGSPAWVGARDAAGALVATARAIGDRSKRAWIYDVVVTPELRGAGVGAAVVRLLLDHPEVRGAARVSLNTRDAQRFYEKFGFAERIAEPLPASASPRLAPLPASASPRLAEPPNTTMVLCRSA